MLLVVGGVDAVDEVLLAAGGEVGVDLYHGVSGRNGL